MLKCNVKYRYLSILIIGVLLACSSNEKAKLPEAKKGILDLRGWDFKIDGPVALNGEWEYYWQKLYNPKDFDSISPMTDGYMKVPGKWFESATDGRSLPLYGYMTYRLIVLTNPFSDKLIFYASRAPATACQVYINDQLVAENGLPGTRKELSHPAGVLDCESFTTEGDTLQVIITISNFHSGFDAGLFNEIKLGESKVLSKSKEREQLQLNFSIGIYLFLTISYLLLFHFLPKNKAILYFSLFIFCLLVASLYSNGTLYRIILFPSSLYKPFETIWIYAIFIIGPTFFIYINTLYKLDMKQIKLEKLYVSYAIIVLVFLLTWQFGLNANLNFGIFILDTFTYLTVIFFIAALYLLILARLRKKDYAIHNIISIAFFLMSVAIAAFHEGSQRVLFFNIGSIVFLVMQAYILSAGFVSTFNKNLELKNELMFLNQNLQHLVDERTHQLDEQKEELQVANMQLEKHQKEIEEVNTILEEQKEELMQQKEELQATLENLQKTQDQLIESEKMAAIGGLVAGVAHEINTPVGIGITAISNLKDDIQRMAGLYEKNEISREDFKKFIQSSQEVVNLIQKNLERTASLVQSFKQVSTDQVTEQKRVFVFKEYLNDILISLRPKFSGKNINFKVECDEELTLNSYPGVHAQIFTNLLLNSLQHGFYKKDNGNIIIKADVDKDLLKIQYSDDGAGISKKDLPHIFEPFYTSDQHRGTGLGLNIIYNLVKQKLHGTINCESEPGKGVLFTIEVPVK